MITLYLFTSRMETSSWTELCRLLQNFLIWHALVTMVRDRGYQGLLASATTINNRSTKSIFWEFFKGLFGSNCSGRSIYFSILCKLNMWAQISIISYLQESFYIKNRWLLRKTYAWRSMSFFSLLNVHVLELKWLNSVYIANLWLPLSSFNIC